MKRTFASAEKGEGPSCARSFCRLAVFVGVYNSSLAAAAELGCHTVYSEDLNHGQNYAGVKVVNPFL